MLYQAKAHIKLLLLWFWLYSFMLIPMTVTTWFIEGMSLAAWLRLAVLCLFASIITPGFLMKKACTDVTLDEHCISGPERRYHYYYPTRSLTLQFSQCQNGLQTRNWFTQLIGLYYLKDQQGQSIIVFKHLYDKALFREINLRIPAGSLSQ